MNDTVKIRKADIVANVRFCSEQAARIAALEAALQRMVDNFRPFVSKPMGAPHSPARLEQEAQIAAHSAARAALQRNGET